MSISRGNKTGGSKYNKTTSGKNGYSSTGRGRLIDKKHFFAHHFRIIQIIHALNMITELYHYYNNRISLLKWLYASKIHYARVSNN
ncbi:hypothetical protein Hanom_Chr15g01398741 [Helianthus anomalus]